MNILFPLLILHILVFISWMFASVFPSQPRTFSPTLVEYFIKFLCFSHYFLSSLHLFFLEWICLTLNMFSLSPFTKIVLSPICSSTTCFFFIFQICFFLMIPFLHFKSTHLFFLVLFWIAMQHSKFILTDVYIYISFFFILSLQTGFVFLAPFFLECVSGKFSLIY